MRIVGTIDLEKFAGAAEGLVTDEVVLTEERAAHIEIQRGGGVLEKYAPYFLATISDPDYIFRDRDMPNTAIAAQYVSAYDAYITLIIRLAVKSDGAAVKNSIITAIPQSRKRFARTMRTNPPIYTKNLDTSP